MYFYKIKTSNVSYNRSTQDTVIQNKLSLSEIFAQRPSNDLAFLTKIFFFSVMSKNLYHFAPTLK